MSITKASLIDLNGQELILDADADTSITADTDDQIDIKIAGSDSIRIKANEIENVSGDLTLDVAGDIILDADGGDISLKDGGTELGKITLDSAGLILDPVVSDKDFFVNGNDGGSGITALRLDMSDAGTAIFNSHVRLGDSKTLSLGAGFDIEITSDGSNGTIATPNGTLTVDSSSDIILDADSASIKLKDGGTQFGSLGSSAGLFVAGTACGIRLHSGGTKIFPTDSAGSAADGTVDLGAVGGAFKDFHLSGNVKIANGQGIDFSATSDATGAANELLDDYEEGIWTPTLTNGGTLTNVGSNYTKIGRLVHLTSYLQNITPTNNSSSLLIGGLPFTVWASGYTYSAGSFSYIGTSSGNVNKFGLLASTGNSYLYFHYIDGTGGSGVTNAQWISEMGSGTGIHLIFHAFYYTDS